MTNDRRPHASPARRSSVAVFYFPLLVALVVAASACQSADNNSGTQSRGIIVVNAPAAGVVRRVLVREGVAVSEGAPIVEIAVLDETPTTTPTPGESAASRAGRNFKAADAEIEAARAEAVRHDAEVQRLTPLVASGEAPQSQLDGERALYERAQQRVQQAQDAKQRAENELRAARSPGQNQESASAITPPRERIIPAIASSAGTVSVINARVGDRVTAGQPLATLRANE
jgi:multidrug efflux pump subunit AcrA (membrane-fusion protein)